MKGFATTSTSRTGRMPLAIAFATILASCSTIPTTPGQSGVSPPPATGRFVPCGSVSIVKFHASNPDDPASVETAANIFDTPETISVARKNNASVREACEK